MTANAKCREGSPEEQEQENQICSNRDLNIEDGPEQVKQTGESVELELDCSSRRSSTSSGAETSTAVPSTATSSRNVEGDSCVRGGSNSCQNGHDVASKDDPDNESSFERVVDQVPNEKKSDSSKHDKEMIGKKDSSSNDESSSTSSDSSLSEHGSQVASGDESSSSSSSSESSSSDSSSDSDTGNSHSDDSVSLD